MQELLQKQRKLAKTFVTQWQSYSSWWYLLSTCCRNSQSLDTIQSQDPTLYSFENFCNVSHDIFKVSNNSLQQLSAKLWSYNATSVLQHLNSEIEDVCSCDMHTVPPVISAIVIFLQILRHGVHNKFRRYLDLSLESQEITVLRHVHVYNVTCVY